MKLDVIVTGAAGRTGSRVFKLLKSDPESFNVQGLVRDIPRAAEAIGSSDDLVEGDITNPETLDAPMTGKHALVVLASAVPRMKPKVEGQPPSFYYDAGGMPEDIDWIGARTQIDLAKQLGINHIVFVGSMGSTDDNNMLNKLGNGNILKCKRKAELYLIESGVPYTIINPSGLLNDPPSERELIVGSNDELFSIFDKATCGIPRADVARIVMSALTTESAKNKAFDVVGKPLGQGNPTTDVGPLFENARAAL